MVAEMLQKQKFYIMCFVFMLREVLFLLYISYLCYMFYYIFMYLLKTQSNISDGAFCEYTLECRINVTPAC